LPINTNGGDCTDGDEDEQEVEEDDDEGSTTTAGSACEESGRPFSHKSRISSRYLSKYDPSPVRRNGASALNLTPDLSTSTTRAWGKAK
jgi:hypothetical protein